MPKGRRPSIGGASRFRPVSLLIAAALPAALWMCGCQKTKDLLEPGSVPSNIVVATYISSAQFDLNPIKLDGQALEREWGGPLDPERPFTQIRLTAEDGSGSPGTPIYLSAKAVYTDTDVFFLMQWTDPRPDELKDALFYVGPSLAGRDSCQEILTRSSSWTRDIQVNGSVPDEDRLALAFEVDPAGDSKGTYRTQGCQVACHVSQSPAFGRLGYGRLDVWLWMSTRTNLSRDLYIQTDDPNSPRYGVPAYLEDYSADSYVGLAADPGQPTYRSNLVPGENRPLYIYRPRDDPYAKPADPNRCFNKFGEKCKINNGLPYYYIWREDPTAEVLPFSACDTLNNAVLPQGQEARPWRYGDPVSAYYYTYATQSRADVRGKAIWSLGVWTLEIGRPLNTRDPANDVIFHGRGGEEVYFTASVANNASAVHWGSGPQILRFGPKPSPGRSQEVGR